MWTLRRGGRYKGLRWLLAPIAWREKKKAGPAGRVSTFASRANSASTKFAYRSVETIWDTRAESCVYWESIGVISPWGLRMRSTKRRPASRSIAAQISRWLNLLRNSTNCDGRRGRRSKCVPDFKNNSRPFRAWITRGCPARKSRWRWPAVRSAGCLRERRRMCADCLVRAAHVAVKMCRLRMGADGPPSER